MIIDSDILQEEAPALGKLAGVIEEDILKMANKLIVNGYVNFIIYLILKIILMRKK